MNIRLLIIMICRGTIVLEKFSSTSQGYYYDKKVTTCPTGSSAANTLG